MNVTGMRISLSHCLVPCMLLSACDFRTQDEKALSDFKEATPLAKEIGQCVGAAGSVTWDVFKPKGYDNPSLKIIEAKLVKGVSKLDIQWLYNVDTKVSELVYVAEPGEKARRMFGLATIGFFCLKSGAVAKPAPQEPPPVPTNHVREPVPQMPSAPQVPEPQVQLPSAIEEPRRQIADDEAASLAQYRMALIGAANKYKRYPRQAMESGWTGWVLIRLTVGANGVTQDISVVNGSGHDLLDITALGMVRQGKAIAQIPAALRDREFTVEVPIIFELLSN